MASDAQRKANAKYLASKKTLTIRIDHDEADEVSEAAEKEGQSVQAYFLQAVRNRLDGSTVLSVPLASILSIEKLVFPDIQTVEYEISAKEGGTITVDVF